MNDDTSDWSVYDEQFSQITDFDFVGRTFHSYPSLRSIEPQNGWFKSKPYKGESYDEAKVILVEGGWNHEHCSFCWEKILDEVPYWANTNEVIILCENCFNHYRHQIDGKRKAEPTSPADG